MYPQNVYKSKKGGKGQESINQVPQLAHYKAPIIPHRKVTKTQFNITDESQEVSPFPAGDQKAAMNRRESMTNTIHK